MKARRVPDEDVRLRPDVERRLKYGQPDWLDRELRFAKDLAALETSHHYLARTAASLSEFLRRLGYRGLTAAAQARLGKALLKNPAFEEKVRRGTIRIECAEAIAPLISEPDLAGKTDWMAEATRRAPGSLRIEVHRRLEEFVRQETQLVLLRLYLPPTVHEDFWRAQDVASARAKETLTLGQTFERVVDEYLDRHDPLRRAKRALRDLEAEQKAREAGSSDASLPLGGGGSSEEAVSSEGTVPSKETVLSEETVPSEGTVPPEPPPAPSPSAGTPDAEARGDGTAVDGTPVDEIPDAAAVAPPTRGLTEDEENQAYWDRMKAWSADEERLRALARAILAGEVQPVLEPDEDESVEGDPSEGDGSEGDPAGDASAEDVSAEGGPAGDGSSGEAPAKRTRTVPAPVERTLWIRSGGRCEVPGCGGRRFLQRCHLHGFARGGEQTETNLLLLCSRHHKLLDRGKLRFLDWNFEGRPAFLRGTEVLLPEPRDLPPWRPPRR